jgi:hypothetical protein
MELSEHQAVSELDEILDFIQKKENKKHIETTWIVQNDKAN